MKKVFILAAAAMICLASCTSKPADAELGATTADSIAVDSIAVDSLAVDSLAVDTVAAL